MGAPSPPDPARAADSAPDSRVLFWLPVVLAVVAFAPSLVAGFVFDDLVLIRDNEFAHGWLHAGRCFTTDLFDTSKLRATDDITRFYRPVACASYALDWQWSGGRPWGFHLSNVLLHGVATWLFMRFARRVSDGGWPAVVAGVVFAVHPARTENVTWISGRTDVLMVVGMLLAVEAWRLTRGRSLGGAAPWALAAVVAWAFAVLSKEYAVLLPALLAWDAWAAPSVAREGRGRGALVGVVLFAALGLVYVLLRQWWLPVRGAAALEESVPLGLRVSYSLLTIGYYVERVVWPWPQCFQYRPIVAGAGGPILPLGSQLLGGVTVLAALAALALSATRPRLRLVVPLAALFAAPLTNVVQSGLPGTSQDRYLYLPLPLAVLVAASAASAVLERHRLATSRALALVALPWLAVCWVRTIDYLDDEAASRAELLATPHNPRALLGVGQALVDRGELRAGHALMRQALAPEAQALVLIARPMHAYLAVVLYQSYRLADGHVEALEALLREGAALALEGRSVGGRSLDVELVAPPDRHGAAELRETRPELAAAMANVAARLGHDELCRRLVDLALADRVTTGVRRLLALALLRIGDHAGARAQIEAIAASDGAAAAEGYGRLVGEVESLRARAATLAPPDRALLEARAEIELGAYLRAARRLAAEPATAARPELLETLVEALLRAGLEADARAVAAELLPPARAAALVGGLAERVSDRDREREAPAGRVAWWPRRGGAGSSGAAPGAAGGAPAP